MGSATPFQNSPERSGTPCFRPWPPPRSGAKGQKSSLAVLHAIYVPFWAVNSMTYTTYWGERGEDDTDTEQYTDAGGQSRTRQVTRTEWAPAFGQVRHHFDDLAL